MRTMTGRERIGCWLGLVALGIVGGCGSFPGRTPARPPHASSSLLDSGPSPRVSSKQTADMQLAIGRTHEEADRLDQAEAAYRSALSKDPRRAEIEGRLAIVLDRKGSASEADAHFARALKLDPKNPDLLCDQGYSQYLRSKNDAAEKSYRAALALAPNHPRSHTNLGLVLAARGESDKAMAEFNRAGTDPADSRSNLALAFALGGRVDAARDQYAEALKAKPKSLAASEGLRVASSVLKAGSTPASAKPKALHRLPGEPAPALVAGSPTPSGAPRLDAAIVPTSVPR